MNLRQFNWQAFWCAMPWFLLVVLLVLSASSDAQAQVRIPEASVGYRKAVQRAAGEYFGLDAPAARIAAQIHQESGWRPAAQSRYAQGLSQFTPATAKWLPEICPELGAFDPWDAMQSVRAMACYDAWLHRRVKSLPGSDLDACSRWHFTLRAYNGGEKWLMHERRFTAKSEHDPNRWDQVQQFRVRAEWAHRENTDYPRRILLRIEPAYRAAGWPGEAVCP